MMHYINKVSVLEDYHLRRAVVSVPARTIKIKEFQPWEPLNLIGLAEVVDTETIVHGQFIHEFKFKAKLKNEKNLPKGPVALLLHAITGEQFVLHTSSCTGMMLTLSTQFPNTPSGSSGFYIEGATKDVFPLCKLIQ